jgi:hypothetical protein
MKGSVLERGARVPEVARLAPSFQQLTAANESQWAKQANGLNKTEMG